MARYNVLFLCTGNSVRSILAEAILNRIGAGRFAGFSAGSYPKSEVNPHAFALLRRLDYPVDGLRSKSWDEFARADAPGMNSAFTGCDNAAGEVCPVWPGQPVTAHWGIADPAAATGSPADIDRAFQNAFRALNNRIQLFVSLPIASLDRPALQRQLAEIGETTARPLRAE